MQQIISFWFEETKPEQWFKSSRTLDNQIRSRFSALLEQAARGELWRWRDTAQGRLAEIILLDQFSRNIYRNTAGAFAHDSMALVLSQEAILNGTLPRLETVPQRDFLLMPCMHSESALVHQWALPLFREFSSPGCYRAAQQHKAVIERFGRYPHRNSALGRKSTPAELEYLQQPGSPF